MYIGLGLPDGYHWIGDGQAEVWRFDGTDYARISDADQFGGGVQSLLLVSEERAYCIERACCTVGGTCEVIDPAYCDEADNDPLTENTECWGDIDLDDIDDLCEEHLVVVLDRTGSMNRQRPSTGSSRCRDALKLAIDGLWTIA